MHKYIAQSLALFGLLGATALFAQPGGQGQWMNPEQRAEQQTAQMRERLALSDAQAAKVHEINLKYARQAQEARQNAEGDWNTMRTQMATIREAHDQELQTVLTKDQWQQWLTAREQMREQMRERRDGQRPGQLVTPPNENPDANKKAKPKKEKKNRGRDANPNGNR